MDHSKDDELRDDVEKNRNCYQVADGCQSAAHQSRAFGFVKNQIAQKWRFAGASILDAVACTERDRNKGLEDESEAAGSVEARDDVLQEPVRKYVEFASVDKFPDCKRDRCNKRDYHKC